MTTNRFTYMTGAGAYYSYERHFQLALHNLDEIVREERLQKRIKKSKNRIAKA